jgi:hypothetical protein
MTSAVALSLTLDVREISVVLLDPNAAKILEDAVTAPNIVFRRPMVKVVVAPMEKSAVAIQGVGVSARIQGIRHARTTISAAVSLNINFWPILT